MLYGPIINVDAMGAAFAQPTKWQLENLYMIIIVPVLVAETILVVWLLILNAKRKQAERVSRKFAQIANAERQHLSDVVANIPVIVWESRLEPTTNSWKIDFVSQHVEKLVGYSVEELLFTTGFTLAIVHEDDREKVNRVAERILAKGGDGNVQCRFRTKDGRTIWVETHIVAIVDDQGIPIALRYMTMDTTDRKLVDLALDLSEAQLAGIIESAMDAIISIDQNHNVVFFNTAAERMFGCSAVLAVGQSVDRFIPLRFRMDHAEHIRAFGETKTTKRSMGSLQPVFGLNAAGEEFPVEAAISQVQVNAAKFYTVIMRDITERLRAEEELKASEANYRSIFNAANDAIFVHEIESGAILDANERVSDLYGYTIEEVKTLDAGDLSSNKPPYTREEAGRRLHEAVNSGPQLFEWCARNKSGEFFWVEVNLKRSVVNGKEVLLAVVRDITKRDRAWERRGGK